MSHKQTSYIAKLVDKNGMAQYSAEENAVWQELITRQLPIVQSRACNEYLKGLELLNLPHDRIPQCPEITAILNKATAWSLEPVPALIPFDQFFYLLANRRFPAATFIRRREELNYLTEPDIFHEIFGHCPMLTNPIYAEFVHTYGKLGLNTDHETRTLLAQLYWFTVEFGLIATAQGLKAYGGGILSSISETVYCIESPVPERRPFDITDALQISYRIDTMQPIYYVLNDFATLYQLTEIDLIGLIEKIKENRKKSIAL